MPVSLLVRKSSCFKMLSQRNKLELLVPSVTGRSLAYRRSRNTGDDEDNEGDGDREVDEEATKDDDGKELELAVVDFVRRFS